MNKSEYKAIRIVPQNEVLNNVARALKLRNEFVKLGVSKRRDFIDICQRNNDFFREWTQMQSLVSFWTGNSYTDALISEVQKAMNAYKATLPQEIEHNKLAQDGKY